MSSDDWNQPRCWSEPSMYASAGNRTPRSHSTARQLLPESNQTSSVSRPRPTCGLQKQTIFCQLCLSVCARTIIAVRRRRSCSMGSIHQQSEPCCDTSVEYEQRFRPKQTLPVHPHRTCVRTKHMLGKATNQCRRKRLESEHPMIADGKYTYDRDINHRLNLARNKYIPLGS